MSQSGLPFNPLRDGLYTAGELFAEFSSSDPDSYARCPDIAILSYFVHAGKNPTRDSRASTLEALHDNSISGAMQALLEQFPKVVALMGGHGMDRGTPSYMDVAYLARDLTARGFLVATGGGPGAMEAAHLGASFSKKSDTDLQAAIGLLSEEVSLPVDVADLIDTHGNINGRIARDLHKWLAPAIAIAQTLGNDAVPSLGVPTWLYGFEPSTPFATHIAKYFQNSLREDGLVTLAAQGIVYAQGSAGTVQEIFQDAAQNYYGTFCPMVFLSAPAGELYWEKVLPVRPLIETLLGDKPGFSRVLFTDSREAALAFLTAR